MSNDSGRSVEARAIAEASEEWFWTLRSIADAVISVDANGHVAFMNGAAEKLIGVRQTAALGRGFDDIVKLVDQQNQPLVGSPLDRVLQQRTPIEAEVGVHDRDAGVVRALSLSVAPITRDGALLGAVLVLRDITEQKQFQRQLEVADRLASLGTMAAGVAHEVNNPLTVVVMNAEFIMGELVKVRHDLGATNSSVDAGTLSRIDESVQALSELRSASSRIERIVASLRPFTEKSPESSAHVKVESALEWATRATVHELHTRASLVTHIDRLPPVRGDELRLGQVFFNLLLNAAQAIEPGNPESNSITVSAKRDGARVVIEIRDTGGGMKPEVQKRIFDPFFTTKPAGVGTGLGLFVCHQIVASFDGEIEVASKIGEGSTFRVILPVATGPRKATPAPLPRPAFVQRARILIVDDEELLLRAIRRALEGHDLVCLERARAALEMIQRGERFDVIFCDVTMPEMSGITLYQEVKKIVPELAERFVFLSGGLLSRDAALELAKLPNTVLEKPVNVSRLLALLARMLDAHQET